MYATNILPAWQLKLLKEKIDPEHFQQLSWTKQDCINALLAAIQNGSCKVLSCRNSGLIIILTFSSEWVASVHLYASGEAKGFELVKAARRMIDWAFANTNLIRLEADTSDRKISAFSIKVGFKYESTRYHATVSKTGEVLNNDVTVLLKEEYRKI